jgi:Ca2+-transporting ATPase
MKKPIEKQWHSFAKETFFQELNSSESGLNEKEVKRRLKFFGYNTLQGKSSETIPRILLRQLHNPIVYVLLFSTGFAGLLGKFTDSLIVFSAVILNTLIGFIQEYRAHKTIRALTSMVPQKTSVLREGDTKLIHSSQLVPGDIVVLQAGDRIAADLRLFSVKNLRCDESTLTGESLPVSKKVDPISLDTVLAERRNMAFNGSYVTSGMGLGIVVATGLKTEFGKISELVEHVVVLETPMSINIRKIAQSITLAVLVVSLGLFLIGYMRGSSFFDAAFAAITLAVAAIPEGLPAIITIASSIGVRRMARKQAIIRQLPAVEALGSTSMICTDKTGTLTYNEMTAQQIWTPSGFSFVSGGGYSLDGHFQSTNSSITNEELEEILRAAILCSDAILDENPNGLIPIGDPTEIALIVAGRKKGFIENEVRKAWERKDIIPFESETRLMATLNSSPTDQYFVFMKGAPEEVVAICKDLSNLEQVLIYAQSMAKEGMRVLAIAKKEFRKSTMQLNEEDIKEGFLLLGFIGMIDPPRKEVYQALKSCHEAGINVKMVTGDHPLTAEAIARDLGILGSGKVVSGNEVSDFNAEDWKKAALTTQVFARVAPEHKLKLVEALQELGHVVAMTGDGVNDAAALKRADIGIAMGIKGTAVAKEASDMILADDNFASIEFAVQEGRRVYDNLIKSLTFVLPTSLGQALVIFFAVLFFPIQEKGILHPLSPIQILWINLVIAVALSLPLAFELPEPDIMKRPPRKKKESILNRFLLIKTLIISMVMASGTIGLFLWEYYRKIGNGSIEIVALAEAQTMAVTAMMLFQIVYLFNCRSLRASRKGTHFFSNPYLFIGIGSVFLAQTAFVYLPIMNKTFRSSPLDLEAWIIIFLAAFLIIPVVAFEKLIKERFSGN